MLIGTRNVIDVVTNTIKKFTKIGESMINPKNISLLLALVFDDPVKYNENIGISLQKIATRSTIPVTIRIYNLPELESELGLDESSTF
jgi:hypothetical protein